MDSPTFHPSKKHIKATIRLNDIITDNMSNDIIIPFFINYSTSQPFVLFIFQKTKDNTLSFIRNNSEDDDDNKGYLSNLLSCFYSTNCTITHRHSCFFEVSNTDLSGTFYNNHTLLWFATSYEIYNLRSIYNLNFEDEVISFFNSNPCLGELNWNDTEIQQPVIAYSIDTLKNSIFQSTFGSKKIDTEPCYSLCNYNSLCNHFDMMPYSFNPLGIVRYALFEPYTIASDNEHTLDETSNIIYSFSNHLQHTPLCYFKE